MFAVDLSGSVALVTGGSRGLGRAAAKLLAQCGADVAVSYRRERAAAQEVVRDCRNAGVQAVALQADMAQPTAAERIVSRTVSRLGRLDILIANAGIWNEASIDQMSDARLEEMIAVNLTGVFRLCRAAVPVMKRQQGGRIVLVSSTAGQRGEAFHSHYAATKGAVISLTKSLAVELARYGILVNCIAPGWFDTDMSAVTLRVPKLRRAVLNTIPLGRVGQPDEFAGAVLFLVSSLSTFVTGEILNVNGGAVLVG